MGEERKLYKVLVGKPEGKRPLGRPSRRWEDGMRMDLREIGLGCVDWIRLAQDRDRWRAVVSAVMNLERETFCHFYIPRTNGLSLYDNPTEGPVSEVQTTLQILTEEESALRSIIFKHMTARTA
jgi:hypothetical protein